MPSKFQIRAHVADQFRAIRAQLRPSGQSQNASDSMPLIARSSTDLSARPRSSVDFNPGASPGEASRGTTLQRAQDEILPASIEIKGQADAEKQLAIVSQWAPAARNRAIASVLDSLAQHVEQQPRANRNQDSMQNLAMQTVSKAIGETILNPEIRSTFTQMADALNRWAEAKDGMESNDDLADRLAVTDPLVERLRNLAAGG